MGNLIQDSGMIKVKVPKLPECPIYKYSFTEEEYELHKFPSPIISIKEYFEEHRTLKDIALEYENAVRFQQRLIKNKERLERLKAKNEEKI